MARILFDSEKWAEAPAEMRGLRKLTGLRRGSVLDAACGTGRHSLALARMGYEVCGVDLQAGYLTEAGRLARKARLKTTFERARLSDLKRYKGRFDLVLNLFTSFGYEATSAANAAVLKQMVAALKPGGQLALELMPRETLAEIFQPRDWQAVPGGYLLQERRWLNGGRRLFTRAIWALKGKTKVRDSIFHTYTRPELQRLFERSGLKKLRSYGDFDGRPFRAGERLLMIGSKA